MVTQPVPAGASRDSSSNRTRGCVSDRPASALLLCFCVPPESYTCTVQGVASSTSILCSPSQLAARLPNNTRWYLVTYTATAEVWAGSARSLLTCPASCLRLIRRALLVFVSPTQVRTRSSRETTAILHETLTSLSFEAEI